MAERRKSTSEARPGAKACKVREREKGKVWVTGGTKWGLEIKGYSQILGILECHTN